MYTMKKLLQKEIITLIRKEAEKLTAVEIILNYENPLWCSVILNDKFCSVGYETRYNNRLIQEIKKVILGKKILLIQFIDNELTDAWIQAFSKSSILERFPDDRRLKFHPYNQMNELFCIDNVLYWHITDEFKGTEHELTKENGLYLYYMVNWYKEHLI